MKLYHLIQQFSSSRLLFATNWTGVCSQLSKITIPTLVVTGTEDVAVPAGDFLIIAQKIPGAWLVSDLRSWTRTNVSIS